MSLSKLPQRIRAPNLACRNIIGKPLCLLFTLLLLAAGAEADQEPKRVLIVHTFERDYAPYSEVAAAFRNQLSQLAPGPIEFRDASLEMARFDGPNRDQPLLDYLSAIYDEDAPDLVVPLGAQAAQFCVRHRGTLFSKSPLLMLAVDKRRLPEVENAEGAATVGLDLAVGKVIENILQLLPDTQHIYLVNGTAPVELYWKGVLQEEWTEFEAQVKFHWLDDQSSEQVKSTVQNLPPQSAVLILLTSRDAAGVPYYPGEVLRAAKSRSNSPIFGVLHGQLGLGIVGGPLVPMPRVGVEGAAAAARILDGTPVESLQPVTLSLSDPVYDWRELKRWSIPTDRLPPLSEIQFREPGIWQSYKTALLVGLLVILAQGTLIVLLLRARKLAKESDANLSLAADAASIGLWRRSPGEKTLYSTSRFRSHFGIDSDQELTLEEVFERIHPEDRQLAKDAAQGASTQGDSFELEIRIPLSDGTTRWLSLHGRAFKGAAGSNQPFGTLGATLDVTDRRTAVEREKLQLKELSHLSRVSSLGGLSAAISHEINQPLSTILNNAQAAQHLLAASKPDIKELNEIVRDIISEDRRAAVVLKRLRDLMRRGETTPQLVDVNLCLEEVMSLNRSDLIGRGIRLTKNYDSNLPQVYIDKVQLQQVLLNLISNACDAMTDTPSDDRALSLTTSMEEGSVVIAVHDRGSGLPPDVSKLFEPFHTTKDKGLGMGLAICRTILTSNHGKLLAMPREDGGSTFRIILPKAS